MEMLLYGKDMPDFPLESGEYLHELPSIETHFFNVELSYFTGEEYKSYGLFYSYSGYYDIETSIFLWESLGEYTIRVEAKDKAGNELTYDYTVKGLFAGVLDFLGDIWASIVGTFQKAWSAFAAAMSWLGNWILEKIKDFFEWIRTTHETSAMGYRGEIADYIDGRRSASSLSITGDAQTFSYTITGFELGLGIFVAVVTGGVSASSSLFENSLSAGITDLISSFTKKIPASFMALSFGMFARYALEIIADKYNISDALKNNIITILDIVVSLAGLVYGKVIGDRDMIALGMGYLFSTLFIIAPSVLSKLISPVFSLSPEDIKTISTIIRAVIVLSLAIITIKSILSPTVTDAFAGIFGYLDEFILGYLTLSSLFGLSETGKDLFQDLLDTIGKSPIVSVP